MSIVLMTQTIQFDVDILRRFESIGDNCEFGLVQTSIGVDHLGFFRFNNTSLEALLRLLATNFQDFERALPIELETACNNELIVYVPDYELRYHTFKHAGETDPAALLAQQRKVLQFLAEKFLDDLKSGNKIFVRKDNAEASTQNIERLHRALQQYGPNRLLWVTTTKSPSGAGRLEPVADGCYRGFMDCFSEYEDARSFSFKWFDLCRNVWRRVNANANDEAKRAPAKKKFHTIRSLGDLTQSLQPETNGSILHNAFVHGSSGIITVGQAVIEESLYSLAEASAVTHPVPTLADLDIPNPQCVVNLPAAYYLLGGGGRAGVGNVSGK